jgi:hypothetical protein
MSSMDAVPPGERADQASTALNRDFFSFTALLP